LIVECSDALDLMIIWIYQNVTFNLDISCEYLTENYSTIDSSLVVVNGVVLQKLKFSLRSNSDSFRLSFKLIDFFNDVDSRIL
jgi:hypothetical protein